MADEETLDLKTVKIDKHEFINHIIEQMRELASLHDELEANMCDAVRVPEGYRAEYYAVLIGEKVVEVRYAHLKKEFGFKGG